MCNVWWCSMFYRQYPVDLAKLTVFWLPSSSLFFPFSSSTTSARKKSFLLFTTSTVFQYFTILVRNYPFINTSLSTFSAFFLHGKNFPCPASFFFRLLFFSPFQHTSSHHLPPPPSPSTFLGLWALPHRNWLAHIWPEFIQSPLATWCHPRALWARVHPLGLHHLQSSQQTCRSPPTHSGLPFPPRWVGEAQNQRHLRDAPTTLEWPHNGHPKWHFGVPPPLLLHRVLPSHGGTPR